MGAARDLWDRSPAARLGLTAVVMIAVAEGAVVLLAPSEEGIPPVPVAAEDHFEPAELARARDYRDGQRLLLIVGIGAQAAALGLLAVGRPRAVRRALERWARRPVAGSAVAGLLVVSAAELASLPAALAAHERAVDAGLSTQALGPWLLDRGMSLAFTGALAAGGIGGLIALARRFPRSWWLPGGVAAAGLGAAVTLLAPVVIAPRFNDFERLPEGSALRASVLDLGRRSGVDIGEVYRVDASRRSTTLNAYVAGLGPTKRVVLYDNLIEDAEPGEVESVVAHELAHVAHADIRRGIAYLALVAPFGLLFTRELASRLGRRAAAPAASPAAVPALILALGVTALLLNIPGNQLSRKVEASADAFALRITGEPPALIALQERLAQRNLSDPDPPGWARTLFGTHPTTLERIGSAIAWKRGER